MKVIWYKFIEYILLNVIGFNYEFKDKKYLQLDSLFNIH